MGSIREPVRRTSIEKKNRIIQKGFELICEKGFHNINCVDIAKYAGVSTGIIYQYFKDKEDIFIQGVQAFANAIMFPTLDVLQSVEITPENVEPVMQQMIQGVLKNHQMTGESHEELLAMMHSNGEIRKLMTENEYRSTEYIAQILQKSGFSQEGLKEKVHLIYHILEAYCHEKVYNKHAGLDYDRMEEEIIRTVKFLLFEE